MKEHIIRELVNRLRETAVKNHDKDCLRDLILKEVLEALNADMEWYRQYGAMAHIKPDIGVKAPDLKLRMPETYDYMTKLFK